MEAVIKVVFEKDGSAEVEFKTVDDYRGIKGDLLEKMLEVMLESFSLMFPPEDIKQLTVYRREDHMLEVEVKGKGAYVKNWEIAGFVMGVALMTAITLSKLNHPPDLICPVN